jgi:hypothetical protein
LLAGTNYTFAVKAVSGDKAAYDAGTAKDLTPFVVKAIATAKWAAPKLKLATSGANAGLITVTLPKQTDWEKISTLPYSSSWARFDVYYQNSQKEDVFLGSILGTQLSAGTADNIKTFNALDLQAFSSLITDAPGSKVNFTVKAVLVVGTSVVNESLGGKLSIAKSLL